MTRQENGALQLAVQQSPRQSRSQGHEKRGGIERNCVLITQILGNLLSGLKSCSAGEVPAVPLRSAMSNRGEGHDGGDDCELK